MIRWEPVTGKPGAATTDVQGVGRYYVRRRAKGERVWIVQLNGTDLGGVWPNAAAARRDIEVRIHKHAAA